MRLHNNKQEILIMLHPSGAEVARYPAETMTLSGALRDFAASIDVDPDEVQQTKFGTRFRAPDGKTYRATFRKKKVSS